MPQNSEIPQPVTHLLHGAMSLLKNRAATTILENLLMDKAEALINTGQVTRHERDRECMGRA